MPINHHNGRTDWTRNRPLIAAIACKISYCDRSEAWTCSVYEWHHIDGRESVRAPEPLECTGYNGDRLEKAIEHFAQQLGFNPADFDRDLIDFSADYRRDYGRSFQLTMLGRNWEFRQIPAGAPFAWPRPPVTHRGQAPSPRSAAALAAARIGKLIGCPVDFVSVGGGRYFAKPLETYADCPCGHRFEIGLGRDPLSQKLGYQVHTECEECGRSAAHCNSRTGEIYSWMTPAAIANARDIMEQMQADADENAFGRDSGW